MAGGSQKYEREIAEILERLEKEEPKAERVKRQAQQSVDRRRNDAQRLVNSWANLGKQLGSATGWTWIGLTLGVGVLGLVLRGISPWLGVLCAVLMFLLFLSPLFGAFDRPEDIGSITHWRGQDVKNVSSHPNRNFFTSLRYRLRRFFERR